MPTIHWRKCQAGDVRQIDDLYRQLSLPKTAGTQVRSGTQRKTQPILSDVGTRLRAAIEKHIGQKITCGTCLSFLRFLNTQAIHDHDAVVRGLYADVPIPHAIRERERTPEARRAWLSSIVAEIIPRPVPVVHEPALQPDGPVTQFLWCYWHAGAHGDEIRWSVRSVEKHFSGRAECLIIGDRPPWYTGKTIHCHRITSGHAFAHGLQDVLHKLRVACERPEVADEFVWMMDDVYLLRPTTLAELRTPRAEVWRRSSSSGWRQIKTQTMDYLASIGATQHDFATHLPHVVAKDKLRSVLADHCQIPRLWEVVYGNLHCVTPQPLGAFFRRINRRMTVNQIRQATAPVNVMNHMPGAWCPAMRSFLQSSLPEPASVEVNESAVRNSVPYHMIIQSAYNDAGLSERRLEISRHTAIVALRTQTRKPIVHLAVCKDDPLLAERIAAFESTGCEIRVLMRDGWTLYREDWELPQGRKIVGRLDDDDVIAKDFCERTAAAAPVTGNHALIWPTGYTFWRQQIHRLTHDGNQFLALITDDMHDPHQEQHWQYCKRWPVVRVSPEYGWIWCRHGDAATSTLPRYRKHQLPRIDSVRFPVNLRAILRAMEPCGQPSGNYVEHQEKERLAHVIEQNKQHAPT